MTMSTVTHIAGPAITACGRLIQRCSLCGEKLVDSKNCMVPVNPDGCIPHIGKWEAGRMVRVTCGTNPTQFILLPDTCQLTDDSCIVLVED